MHVFTDMYAVFHQGGEISVLCSINGLVLMKLFLCKEWYITGSNQFRLGKPVQTSSTEPAYQSATIVVQVSSVFSLLHSVVIG